MREPGTRRSLGQIHDDHVKRNWGLDKPRGRRLPRGATRERILDVALDLFTEHGYDKTSLREIADELGFTKAALYYHFERKEDILLALHLRLHELGSGALERLARLSDDGGSVEAWMATLDQFIDQVLENRRLFLFHVRNQNALSQLEHAKDNEAEHEDLHERLRRVLLSPSFPLALRVRMACAIGAVMGSLMGSSDAFADVAPEELGELVREAVRDLMALGDPQPRPTPRRRAQRRRA